MIFQLKFRLKNNKRGISSAIKTCRRTPKKFNNNAKINKEMYNWRHISIIKKKIKLELLNAKKMYHPSLTDNCINKEKCGRYTLNKPAKSNIEYE